ncbi:MAG: hypothetical protein Q8N31_06090 [Reyranella sp.]|nr:hypothetical protein [Reyranella sp.]MDP3159566.1 hypothetical protein [Reyranella sp.]
MRITKEPRSDDLIIMNDCEMCGNEYRDGQHVYKGRNIHPWKIRVCRTCHVMNWDGIVEDHQPRLMAHLAKHQISVEYNKAGWIKWPAGYEPMPPPMQRRVR